MTALIGRTFYWTRVPRLAPLFVAFAMTIGLFFCTSHHQAQAGQVTLAWDASTAPEVTGYKLYSRAGSGAYGQPIDVGNVTSYTVTGLTDGMSYSFVATVYDSVGNESGYSNEVTYAVPGIPEINILGNAVNIIDGDGSPSTTDHTNFGTVGVGDPAVTRTFTIQNTGTSALNLTGSPLVAIGGANAADFTVTVQPAASIAPGASTTFKVSFNPGAAGARLATISIASNDANENPYDFAIQGTGATAPEINVLGNGTPIADGDTTPTAADNTDFGKAKIDGGIVTRTFTIQNTGTSDLSLSGTPRVAVNGAHAADFTVTVQPSATLAPGASATFTVSFDPSAGGTRLATITITSNDTGGTPYDFTIQGLGVSPPVAPGNLRIL